MKISKRDQLIFEAMDAGFQNFEAEAFYHCLKRFKTKAQEEAAAAEREECAKVVDKWFESMSSEPEMKEIAAEIRARGSNEQS